jgi:hypothetical protein
LVFVAFRDLPPEGQEAVFVAIWILAHGMELMEVQDDKQPVRQRLLDGPIKSSQPLVAEFVIRAHPGIAERMQVDADVVESCFFDQRNMPVLESGVFRGFPCYELWAAIPSALSLEAVIFTLSLLMSRGRERSRW